MPGKNSEISLDQKAEILDLGELAHGRWTQWTVTENCSKMIRKSRINDIFSFLAARACVIKLAWIMAPVRFDCVAGW